MRVTCRNDRCQWRLFNVDRFTGVVETKCPHCKLVQTFRYGSDREAVKDVRCVNSFKGRQLGGWCGMLIARISYDSGGSFGYKCPRCGDRKTIHLAERVLTST